MAVTVDPAVFAKARDAIHDRGWAQNELETSLGAVCVRGALNVALFGDALFVVDTCARWERAGTYVRVLADVLDNKSPTHVDSVEQHPEDDYPAREQITDWNDDEARTAGEVLDLLDRAEQAAKEQAS